MLTFPESDNPPVADFVDAVRRRSRALRSAFAEMSLVKVIERSDDGSREKIELTLRRRAKSPKSLTIRVFFWDDRWVWIDAREAAPQGGKFEWTIEGRLAGDKRAADIIAEVEKSYAILAGSAGEDLKSAADKLWKGVLLGGSLPGLQVVGT